jgi:hypothetical protein
MYKQYQWIQNVQKPLAGLLRHLIRPKNEEDRPPAILFLQACCLWFAKMHLLYV